MDSVLSKKIPPYWYGKQKYSQMYTSEGLCQSFISVPTVLNRNLLLKVSMIFLWIQQLNDNAQNEQLHANIINSLLVL